MNENDANSGDGRSSQASAAEGAEREEAPQHDIEASLNDALSHLERMLGQPRVTALEDVEHEDIEPGEDGSQIQSNPSEDYPAYDVPLLQDVVIPGPGVCEAAYLPKLAVADGDEDAGDAAALRRRLAARLASEIEVIVQDRMERAMEKVYDEIRERVRDHMDIILPEIVEDMLAYRHRGDD